MLFKKGGDNFRDLFIYKFAVNTDIRKVQVKCGLLSSCKKILVSVLFRDLAMVKLWFWKFCGPHG